MTATAQHRSRASNTALLGVFAGILCVGLFLVTRSESPGVVAAACGSLMLILGLHWRPDEPPILLFPLLYQWSEVSVKPILSAVEKTHINSLAEFGGDIQSGAYFGFSAIVALAIGMRVGLSLYGRRVDWEHLLETEVASLSKAKILQIALLLLILGQVFNVLSVIISPLRQVFIAMGFAGFAGIFVYSYWALRNRSGYIIMFAILAVEIVIGLTGFFADFKGPLLIFCLSALCARRKLSAKDVLTVIAAGAVLISVATFWSYVKKDYREYVRGGSIGQVVTVPLADRIGYISDQFNQFDESAYGDGFSLLMARHSYIDYLSNTMQYIPQYMAHEDGSRLSRTIIHIITPRFLFPNKPSTESDSEVTRRYSGVVFDVYEGTSISIGYLGELYIDFGKVISILICFVGGLGYAQGYRMLRDGPGLFIIRFALCAATVCISVSFGTALIKFVGGVITAFVGSLIVQRYVLPRVLNFISRQRPRRVMSQRS